MITPDVIALPQCPVCEKPMDAVLRRNDIVLMTCVACRVSATIPASVWEANRAHARTIPTDVSPAQP
jgi:Zn ribbon nucleic-acid-binding protein